MDTTTILWGTAACSALLLGLSGYALRYRRRTANHPNEPATQKTAAPNVAQPPVEPNTSPLQTAPTEHLERCSRMAGVFAHDFNNIMTAIGGFAALLKKRTTDDEKATRYINGIIEAQKHASELLDRLSLIAGDDTHYTTTFDVNEVIRDVCEEYAAKSDATEILPPDCPVDPLLTKGDPKRFRIVITNLCINAIDACKEGEGTVRFTAESTNLLQNTGTPLPATSAPGAYLHISVTDSGKGMSDHVRKHLFDPFFTTKPKGTVAGLGLSFVWRYVTSCKGTVELESAPDKGTAVHLYLPQVDKPTQAEAATPATRASTGSRVPDVPQSVLVVDDEESVRDIYTEILEDNGYTVASCTNGREACNYVNSTVPTVDIVVLDVMMPVMDGIQTFSELRNAHPGIKILLMSGYHTTNTVSTLIKQPATDFFEKPGSSDLLLNKIRTLLSN